MERIEPPKVTRLLTYECPKCGETMRSVASCSAHVCDSCKIFFLDEKRGGLFSTEFEPIIEESKKHYDHKMMELEMNHFGFSKEQLEEYNIGYLPFGYWAWKEYDCVHGTLTFPMKDWKGSVTNILGKHIGSDDKIDLARAIHKLDERSFGVFNIDAFWEQEVHVYSNPTECLKALLGGQKNSACVCGRFVLPEIFAPKKIYVHTVLPMVQFVKSVRNNVDVA